MSSPTPENRPRGRGRGRKDLTPSERVANWVNQREAKRLSQEKWANRNSNRNGPEENAQGFEQSYKVEDSPMCTSSMSPDSVVSSAKSKKTNVALYVPPSLRNKKLQGKDETESSFQVSPGHDRADQPSPSVSEGDRDASSLGASSSSNQSDIGQNKLVDEKTTAVKPRGRGRGRKKPEMEMYVPRALRAAAKSENKVNSQIQSLKSEFEDKDKDCNSSNDHPGSYSKMPDSSLENKAHKVNRLVDDDKVFTDADTSSAQNNKCVSSDSSAFYSNTNSSTEGCTSPCLEPSESISSTPVTKECFDDINNPSTESPTFEFYDPAVVAFMPSSEIVDDIYVKDNDLTGQTSSHEIVSNYQEQPNISSYCKEQQQSQDYSLSLKTTPGLRGEQDPMANQSGATVSEVSSVNIKEIPSDTVLKVNAQTTVSANPMCSIQDMSAKIPQEKREPELCDNEANDGSAKKKTTSGADSASTPVTMNKSSVPQDTSVAEDDDDSWLTMYDENGDCVDESLMAELNDFVGKVEIDKPKINYLKYEPKEPELNYEEYSHIIEIYDFSDQLATCDLIAAFKDFASRGFDVKWVDDTHALGVFSSAVAANEALRMMHPLLKVRPMSEASKKGQSKARSCQEFLQPYKARPQTSSLAARRLVAGALGVAPKVSREVRDQERKKLKEAKEKRRQERQQKVDIWDGTFGSCAMDQAETS